MSTRLCLSFERTPQWFKNNKLLFHFDKTTCRIVGDLEYLIRRKFAITSVCHLYLDGYLLPSQESIDLVRDGDNLRVENEALCHLTDENTENCVAHTTDTDKSHSLSTKRKHSLSAKLQASKYPRSSLGKAKSAGSGTESSKSGHNPLFTHCESNASFHTDNSTVESQQSTSKSSTSSHTKKSSLKQKHKKDINSSDTNKSSTKQKHKKKKTVVSLKKNKPSSSESSSSESTESSFETESSTTESSFVTEDLSTGGSSETETSTTTESPSSKPLAPLFPSETSTFESGLEPANSKRHTKKPSADASQSSSCSSALPSKSNSSKRASKGTVTKNSKKRSSPSHSSSDQSKVTRTTSKSPAITEQSSVQSNKNTECLSSIGEESSCSMSSSKQTAYQSSTLTGVPTQTVSLPSRISNSNHIRFDSDEDESNSQQELCNSINHSLMINHNNGVGITKDRGSNNVEKEATNTQLSFIGCNGSTDNDGKNIQMEKVLDFSVLPPLCGPPRMGDRIAYKILEISASYTPEMSDYKEGVVLAYDPKVGEVLVELTPESLIKPLGDGNVSNKFELLSNDEEEEEDDLPKALPVLERKVTVLWSSMVSPKLINSC